MPAETEEEIEEIEETVRLQETVTAGDAKPADRITESGEQNTDYGWIWEMTMIRPGISRNRTRYRPEVLAEAAALYEGARGFDGHRDDGQRQKSSVGSTVGFWSDVRQAEDGRLVANFNVLRSSKNIRDTLVAAYEAGRADLIGVSHDVFAANVTAQSEAGAQFRDVGAIVEVSSVDLVAEPSAGGGMERLVAGGETQPTRKEGTMPTRDELLQALAEDEELAEAARERLADKEPKTDEPVIEPVKEGPEVLTPGTLLHRAALREALADSALPESMHSKIREALATFEGTFDQMAARVSEYDKIWSELAAAAPQPLAGQAGAEVTADQTDIAKAGLDGMLLGEAQTVNGEKVAPFHSIKQAYAAFTGRREHDGISADFSREILAASAGAASTVEGARRMTESLTTASWAQALGDSITRRAIAEYSMPQRQSWRQIVSEFSSLNDFREQKPFRIGGYDVLPTVAESGPYVALTSPADEETPYTPAKKGGTEDLTWETIRNDDVGALRKIPINLGRSAGLTIYTDIWTILSGNAAIYDAVALFAAGHNNDQAIALSDAGLTAARTAMRRQARDGETSGDLNIVPKILVVPPELEQTGFQLVTSAVGVSGTLDSTVPNLHQGYQQIVVPEFADANDWFVIADPAMVPTIEVGFLDGKQEPEILIQDQPTVGTVFTNDVYTYKVRFVYGYTVLDYRGMFRGTQV